MNVTSLQELYALVEQKHGLHARELVQKANDCMVLAHKGQMRIGGGPYHTHPQAVAFILASQGYTDPLLLCGALLHDVIEDTSLTLEDICTDFSEELCFIVGAVTDFGEGDGNPHISDKLERKPPTHKKILELGEQDPRIFLIKLADRIHNLQTREVLSKARQERMVDEAKAFHLPLAKKVGNSYFIKKIEALIA